jgi:hypothetical protein
MTEAQARLIASLEKEIKSALERAKWLDDLAAAGSLDRQMAALQSEAEKQSAESYRKIRQTMIERWGL